MSTPGGLVEGSGDREEVLRRRETDLLHVCATRINALSTDDGRRHLKEGFYRRLLMIQTSRINILATADPKRMENLGTYECADLNIHLNAYFFQVRGCLDNLAWALKYEKGVLSEVSENSSNRNKCYLFGARMLEQLHDQDAALAEVLHTKASWAREFKERRDPAAHRIPLYAIPGIVTTEEEVQEFQRLDAAGIEAAQRGDWDAWRDRGFEATRVGRYQPLFVLSNPDGLQVRSIPEVVASDQAALLDVSEAAIASLLGG